MNVKILLTLKNAYAKISRSRETEKLRRGFCKMKKKFKIKISVWQFLALGYLAVILTGSVLLIMPFATASGQSTNYLDALFTATSATCVTGLAVHDTGTHWTLFGQLVILFLIQTGGLGFMTFVTAVFRLLHGRISLYERKALLASSGGEKHNGLWKMIKSIFIGTAIFEFTGAFILCFRFVPQYGWGDGIYFSVWHSVSAFCNAGFDLMGKYGQASLSGYANDPLVTLTLSALIILGGLGFCVWSDVVENKFKPSKLTLNTKVVLLVSTVLIVLSTALFMTFEWNNKVYENFNFGEKLLASFFNAVSPRTAGFFSTAPVDLSESGYVLTVILMFIGGNSGSTAGGIKVGTFAVILMGMLTVFRGRSDINLGKKRIEQTLLSQALAIFTAFLMLAMLAVLIICAVDPNVNAEEALFECVSALSTSGLSLDVTPKLGAAARVIIVILMYAGRVGILTLALALGEKRTTAEVRKPVDTLLIG